jgi:hypothetical protein
MELSEKSLVVDKPHYIVPCNKEDKDDKDDKAHLMDKAFFVGINRFPAQPFDSKEHKSGSVETRKRYQVECADKNAEE